VEIHHLSAIQQRPVVIPYHAAPETTPVTVGESLAGCATPPEQLAALFEAGRKYRSFKYWDKVKVGSSESHITGQGFNAVKFDSKKPARTIRRNDGNLGMTERIEGPSMIFCFDDPATQRLPL
jgi:hypothetical protein